MRGVLGRRSEGRLHTVRTHAVRVVRLQQRCLLSGVLAPRASVPHVPQRHQGPHHREVGGPGASFFQGRFQGRFHARQANLPEAVGLDVLGPAFLPDEVAVTQVRDVALAATDNIVIRVVYNVGDGQRFIVTLKPTDFRDTRTSGANQPTCAI